MTNDLGAFPMCIRGDHTAPVPDTIHAQCTFRLDPDQPYPDPQHMVGCIITRKQETP